MLGVLLSAIALSGMPALAETVLSKKVIEVPSAKSNQILEKVVAWSGKYARTYNTESNLVTAKGEISYPTPPTDRIQYTILFDMKNVIQGDKDTVTFDNVMLKAPERYTSSDGNERIKSETYPLASRAVTKNDVAAVNSRLIYIANNLETFLLSQGDSACPMTKCPECGVLQTSKEEMKEHMKEHGHKKGCPLHEAAPTN